jgi:hypothetical protein
LPAPSKKTKSYQILPNAFTTSINENQETQHLHPRDRPDHRGYFDPGDCIPVAGSSAYKTGERLKVPELFSLQKTPILLLLLLSIFAPK